MSFDAGFLLGLSMGGGGDEPEEEWSPPADWPDVPEPGDYEICLLVVTTSAPQTIFCTTTDPQTANTGVGSLVIDWGDGTVKEYSNGEWSNTELYHSYAATGKYIIKITTTSTSCFLQAISFGTLLIAKLGKEIIINNGSKSDTQRAFYNQYSLQYIKLGGKGGLARSDMFNGDYALQKVDIAIPPTIIPPNTFTYTDSLRKFDFSEVITVETQGVYYSGFNEIYMPKCQSVNGIGICSNASLRKVNLPLCTIVAGMGQNYQLKTVNLPLCTSLASLSSNRALTELIVATNCTFGTNCFSGCYNLIPHPDGTDIRK